MVDGHHLVLYHFPRRTRSDPNEPRQTVLLQEILTLLLHRYRAGERSAGWAKIFGRVRYYPGGQSDVGFFLFQDFFGFYWDSPTEAGRSGKNSFDLERAHLSGQLANLSHDIWNEYKH